MSLLSLTHRLVRQCRSGAATLETKFAVIKAMAGPLPLAVPLDYCSRCCFHCCWRRFERRCCCCCDDLGRLLGVLIAAAAAPRACSSGLSDAQCWRCWCRGWARRSSDSYGACSTTTTTTSTTTTEFGVVALVVDTGTATYLDHMVFVVYGWLCLNWTLLVGFL